MLKNSFLLSKILLDKIIFTKQLYLMNKLDQNLKFNYFDQAYFPWFYQFIKGKAIFKW